MTTTSITIPSRAAHLNEAVAAALKEILSFPTIAGTGSGFDNTCTNTFLSVVSKAMRAYKGYSTELLGADECKKIRENRASRNPRIELQPYLKLIAKGIYDFSGLVPLPSSDVYLLRQPCGTQNWPDLVILYEAKALPIEFKSSKDSNKLLWNSNLPQSGIYIFNGKSSVSGVGATTCFLAHDVITSVETGLLVLGREEATVVADKINVELKAADSSWSLYIRPMHNWCDALLQSTERLFREENVLAYAAHFFDRLLCN